ncbi:hypothetical protein [Escherichia coli]|uniref:hypothetical protein n=1 Tax=Escherichia coli TaxID=562 RepID=UPI0012FF76D2|nr:hypothetical protein [Escherichia coli]
MLKIQSGTVIVTSPSHFAKAYDDYVRSVLEYAIYMITMLRVFVIARRTLFEREVKL